MELSDKVRRVALTLAVGSVGVGIGYVANDVVEAIGEMRKESRAEKSPLNDKERVSPYLYGNPEIDHPSTEYEPPRSEIIIRIRGGSFLF